MGVDGFAAMKSSTGTEQYTSTSKVKSGPTRLGLGMGKKRVMSKGESFEI